MYGIDKLKDVGTDLAKFGMKIEEALEDKKLSWSESLGIGVFAVPKVVKYIGDAEQIKNEKPAPSKTSRRMQRISPSGWLPG